MIFEGFDIINMSIIDNTNQIFGMALFLAFMLVAFGSCFIFGYYHCDYRISSLIGGVICIVVAVGVAIMGGVIFAHPHWYNKTEYTLITTQDTSNEQIKALYGYGEVIEINGNIFTIVVSERMEVYSQCQK